MNSISINYSERVKENFFYWFREVGNHMGLEEENLQPCSLSVYP